MASIGSGAVLRFLIAGSPEENEVVLQQFEEAIEPKALLMS